MFKLVIQPQLAFVNKLIDVISTQCGSTYNPQQRVWVGLSAQSIYFHNANIDKKCTVVVFGAICVEYMFLEEDGSNGVKKISTFDDVNAIAKEIISYFDEGYTND